MVGWWGTFSVTRFGCVFGCCMIGGLAVGGIWLIRVSGGRLSMGRLVCSLGRIGGSGLLFRVCVWLFERSRLGSGRVLVCRKVRICCCW